MNQLTQETATAIRQELEALVKNPAHGWDQTYPTLYGMLLALTQEFCTKLNCPTPGIFISFLGLQRHQASAYVMTDGSTQLHIGSTLIAWALQPELTPKEATARFRAFTWIIAHEICHLSDPAFKNLARSYTIRTMIDNVCYMVLTLGTAQLSLQAIGSQITFISYPAWYLVALGTAVLTLKKVCMVVLHRHFEYTADAMSARVVDGFAPQDAQQAIEAITTAMTHELEAGITSPNKLWRAVQKKIGLFKLFYLHPSIARRVARLSK